MDKALNENLPIYMQIMDRIRAAIVSGELRPGAKVATVRELAEDFGVNPNTMQRALSELEREGLLISERTSGRFVTHNRAVIDTVRRDAAQKIVGEFLQKMKELGFTREQIEVFFREAEVEDADADTAV
ncbi:GntR family transcriptional regulator [Ihubacter sp. rT4E-8]|uniref:GntR family transcriptional regulator n=1 Tax=Ihubacter sp. rT4E-8 TaxID=3242369 RepID=UPI003CEE05BB